MFSVSERLLETIDKSSSLLQAELMDGMSRSCRSAAEMTSQADELKDPVQRNDLAAARAVSKKHSMILLTTRKAYVRHPELAVANANMDYVLRQVSEAVDTITDIVQGKVGVIVTSIFFRNIIISHLAIKFITDSSSLYLFTSSIQVTTGVYAFKGTGELTAALDSFIDQIIINPLMYEEHKYRPSVEERLENIISQLVHGVREIKRAVLFNRGEEEIHCDTELDDQSEIRSQRPKVQSRLEKLLLLFLLLLLLLLFFLLCTSRLFRSRLHGTNKCSVMKGPLSPGKV